MGFTCESDEEQVNEETRNSHRIRDFAPLVGGQLYNGVGGSSRDDVGCGDVEQMNNDMWVDDAVLGHQGDYYCRRSD